MNEAIKLRLYFSGSTGKVVKYDVLSGSSKAADCIFKVLQKKARVTRFQSAQDAANRTF